jgi:hypothetical protein
MANEILDTAEDIVLIRPAQSPENYIFAVRPDFATMKRYFEATISNPDEREADAFSDARTWTLDEAGQEINGSSTFLGLRFDKVIRPQGLRVPGVLEGRVLDSKRKLSNGVYRDFGMAVFSGEGYNAGIACSLLERAKREGWQTPLLVPFRSLDYKLNGDSQYGVDVFFVEAPKGVIQGKEAGDVLRQFYWKGDHDALRLYRNNDGYWYANRYVLPGSNARGRVGDWICGEARRADLVRANAALGERKYSAKIKELQAQMRQKDKLFNAELEVK